MKIRAGLLRDILTFKEAIKSETASGFSKEGEYREVLTAKAYKERSSGKETEQGKEIVNTYTLTFLLRYHPLIKENQIVTYAGSDYDISFLNPNLQDRSMEVTLTRRDK